MIIVVGAAGAPIVDQFMYTMILSVIAPMLPVLTDAVAPNAAAPNAAHAAPPQNSDKNA